jgi:uncharacterized LabA/DUF88 family protein
MANETATVYLDQNNIFFRYKKLDFRLLLEYINNDFDVIRATSYMSYDPEQSAQKGFITYMANNGWKCNTISIKDNTNIDHMLMADMMNDFSILSQQWVVLIAGDGDYAYMLDLLSKRGCRVYVIGARGYISLDLLKVADKVKYIEDLDKVIIETV